MSILNKLGLERKKRKESVPGIGLSKNKNENRSFFEDKKNYLRGGILFIFLALILVTLPQSSFQPVENYIVGEPWRADDLTAPFTFAIKKTSAELEEERDEIRQQTAPIYHINNNASIFIEARTDSLFRNLQPVLDSYLQWQRSKSESASTTQNDSLSYLQERSLADIELNDEAWSLILENYVNINLNNQAESRLVINQIRNQLEEIIGTLLSDGLLNQEKDSIDQNEITVRNLRELTERTISLTNTRDLDGAYDYAQLQFNRIFMPDVARAALQIYEQVIRPNLIYSESDTQALLEENLSNISTTRGAVDQGEIIIRRGDIVTPEIDIRLKSLADARSLSATEMERWLRFSGESFVVIIATMMFFFYLYLYRRKIFERPSMFLLVFLVMGLVTFASAMVYPIENVKSFIIPVAIAPIILTIIFDSRVGLMATITLAIITGIIHDHSFNYMVATTAACSLGVFSVRDIKKRSQFFFITPGIVFLTYGFIIAGFSLSRFSGWENFLNDMTFVAINSVFILFTYPLILLFEKLFKLTTDFTLLELADTNLPLMKKLMSTAPGTFHHSLQLANLAESAASDIGANSLLCRVGAMYHDIGKMVKPSYFIENQSKSNEHDKLKPRMSALVIKAHVSEGVKMAVEHGLPNVIIDFISTHHGTSRIKFFLDKAKEGSDNIQEEDFRYDGPIPFTKEQGILMLADGVEASCRSMKDTTYTKLENQINRIIDQNVADGQLSNCPLTFQHIQIIKESFLRILKGVYHSRIEYPEDKKEAKKKDNKEVSEQMDEEGNE
ncbi:MAG: HDIG domain-containing metalloprotein [Balneolaceae bacterium]